MTSGDEEQTGRALQEFAVALDRAWALGLAAHDALLPQAPNRAASVWSVLWQLRRAVTVVLPHTGDEHLPVVGLGVEGAVTRGFELDMDPELRPFSRAAVEVDRLWQQGLGLDVDWRTERPAGWSALVAQLQVPELPPPPPGIVDPDAHPQEGDVDDAGGRWWSLRRR